MTKSEIVGELARDGIAEQIARNAFPSMADYELQDLAQMTYLALLEQDEDKVVKAHTEGWIRFFVTAVIKNSVTPTGRYYQTYTKWERKRIDMNKDTMDIIYEDE